MKTPSLKTLRLTTFLFELSLETLCVFIFILF